MMQARIVSSPNAFASYLLQLGSTLIPDALPDQTAGFGEN